jgi:hypothetical protein
MNNMTNNGPHELHEYASAVTEKIEQLGKDGLEALAFVCLTNSPNLNVEGYPYDIVVWDCSRLVGGEVGESADFEYFQLTLSFDEGDEESYALYDIKREKVYDYYYNFPKYLFGEE